MIYIIGLLTVVLVLNCLLLILLVLIQLPKKEAGAGLAFGGGATDALFGAGSGNVLTKITKVSAGIFFALALILSVLNTRANRHPDTEFRKQMGKAGAVAPMVPAPATTKGAAATTNLEAMPLLSGTNAAPTAATNPPVVPAK
ncbi:MAG: preprotein translocase subunit SecG [Pedosphaera sp.]|nr:preprotein translocase subunit SecG [Pedosphaera sp.]